MGTWLWTETRELDDLGQRVDGWGTCCCLELSRCPSVTISWYMMWCLCWGWNDTMESCQLHLQEMTCAYKDAKETENFSNFYNSTPSSISTTALFKMLFGVNLILEKPPCVKHGRFRANSNNRKRWLLLLLGFHPVAQAFLLLLLRTFLGELEDCVEKPEMVGTCFLKRVSMSDGGCTTDVLEVSRESSSDAPH